MASEPRFRGPWRRALGTVRVRTTLLAALVVGVALIVGAATLVVTLRRSLTSDLRTALELRAADVVSVLEEGTPPRALAVDDGEEAFVQVLAPDGRVVAATPNMEGEPPAADLAPGRATDVENLPLDDGGEEFLVVAAAAETSRGRFVVLAGRSLDVVGESTGFVARVLTLGVPALILLVGLTTWRLVGRALRPVEAIRAEVDAISGSELHRRVPEPGTEDEIGRLAGTMNEMLARLEAARARERRFVSDASHELRSPVASIRQHAEVARAHPAGTSMEELVDVVLAEDLRLERLVDDLLFLARSDEHRASRPRRPIDVDDLVFEEAGRLRSTTDLRINTEEVGAARVLGDATSLARLVRNLADNAARHARHAVSFRLDSGDGEVVFVVEDDGPGIPTAERERVFERFVRLDEARARESGGSGLGLSIAREITVAHGGAIQVGDGGLGGAAIVVRLPASAD